MLHTLHILVCTPLMGNGSMGMLLQLMNTLHSLVKLGNPEKTIHYLCTARQCSDTNTHQILLSPNVQRGSPPLNDPKERPLCQSVTSVHQEPQLHQSQKWAGRIYVPALLSTTPDTPEDARPGTYPMSSMAQTAKTAPLR